MFPAQNPFEPYNQNPNPILIQEGGLWETDELIAPQITFDSSRGDCVLFYTGTKNTNGGGHPWPSLYYGYYRTTHFVTIYMNRVSW